MAVIGGCIFVIVAVLVGFTMAGGHVGALIHPSEVISIGGSAFGALIVMSPKKVMIDLFKGILQLLKGSPYNRKMYVELFGLIYEIARTIRRDGVLALEAIIGDPHHSPVFKKYPLIDKNHHAKDFLCTALAQLVDSKATAEQLQQMFDEEIDVMDREHHMAVHALTKTADALPGFGIVAAVLGIVITMGAIDGPPSEIGHKVGAALVGTFLGILLSYGFLNPMAGRMECLGMSETIFFKTISAAVIAMNAGDGPRDVIRRARRIIGTEDRPTLAEMNAITREGS